MNAPDSFDRRRRTVLAAAAATMAASAAALSLWPRAAAAQDGAPGKARIGIIGAGRIGGTVGGFWVKAGHPVMFSSRDPAQVAGAGRPARAAGTRRQRRRGRSPSATSCSSPCRTRAMPEIGRDYGAALKGKVVLDAGNAVAGARRRDRRRGRAATASASPRRSTCRARAWCAPSTRSATRSSRARRTEPIPGCRFRSPATMPAPCRSRPASCATPASSRWSSASSPTRAASSAAAPATGRR